MKLNIKEYNLEPIRKLLTYTESEQLIAVSNEDIDNLFDSATTLCFQVSHGDNLEDALQKLDKNALELEKTAKAIFVVQCSQSYKIQISELADLQQYINDNLPQADVRWGFATRSESEENIHVVAVITH